ncbi:MAG: amino acid-binding protein [Lachnospiraceae bacterium]|nr:amino acid-binding protein [Lachnospiraceae bacterium]
MFLKQVSVFLENSEGRLKSALLTLKDANIDIKSLSLADTRDYGMLRMIVSDPDGAVDALKTAGFSAHITKVLAVKLADRVGALADFLKDISGEGINIEYMYDLSLKEEGACMVLKVSDKEACERLMAGKQYEFVSAECIK